MSEDTKVWVMLAIVAAGVLVAASWSRLGRRAHSPRAEDIHRALMAVCAAFGVWAFTLFGALHDHGAHGHQLFHAHDCYHYYFGSKYLKEWGYDGMYFATVAALEEVGREEPRKAITFNRIRDLDGSARFLYRPAFEPHLAEARARFSPARWAELKKDLSFLRDITPNNDWWHGVVLDNGFNPPPSFAAITGPLANLIAFDDGTWKFLGLIDVALMGAGVAAIAWAFGMVPALFAIVVTGNAPITTFNWTGGSFFRQLWLFCLTVGLSMLAKKKWYGAGAALGACTACVFFPVFFVVGAATPLAYKYRVHQARGDVPPWRRELAQFAIGVAAAMAFLLGLSLVVYGREPWWQWWHRIVAHDLTFFDNHIGLKKITTFAPEVGQQAFGASDFVFPDWNQALVARAHRGHVVELLLSLLLSGWFIFSGLRARAADACLVVGSALIVIWTMPAGYYTIYAGALAAVTLANRSLWGERRFAPVAVALVAAVAMRSFERDLITQSALISAGWVLCLLAMSVMFWLEHAPLHQSVAARQRTVKVAMLTLTGFLLVIAGIRDWGRDAAFLPCEVASAGRVLDRIDFGANGDEAAHHVAMKDHRDVPRKLMDVFGYLVSDDGRVLKKGDPLDYILAAPGGTASGRELVIRTDSFYKGDLKTTVNDRELAPVHLAPHRSLFAYVHVPLPPDLGDGTLHVHQETTANDVGIFSAWLVQ